MDHHRHGAHHTRKETFNRMRYRAMRGKLGKPTRQWTLLRELWRILFMPNRFIRNERSALRLETSDAVAAPLAKNAIHDLICSMLAHERLPTLCCRIQSHFIPTSNGDQRLIRALCPSWARISCEKCTPTPLDKPLVSAMEGILDGGARARSYSILP